MGVKSTITLTREEADNKFADLREDYYRRLAKSEAALLTDTELEDKLMQLNDDAHDGEGFENYRIRYVEW
jgi:hypothetical protein